MKRTIATLIFFFSSITPCFAIQPTVGTIKDTRTTGQFFGGLEIDLNLLGDDVDAIESLKVVVDKAIDDTGRDLNKGKDDFGFKNDFTNLSQFGQRKNSITLNFKNPARKALSVAELSGSLVGYSPNADPKATIKISNFLSASGKPIENAVLKEAGLTVTVLTAADRERIEKEKMVKMQEELQKKGLGGALASNLSSMFSGGENTLTFEVQDSKGNLVSYQVLDSSGEEMKSNGWSTSGTVRTVGFQSKVPDDAALRINLLTPKSMIKVPFKLTAIPLP